MGRKKVKGLRPYKDRFGYSGRSKGCLGRPSKQSPFYFNTGCSCGWKTK